MNSISADFRHETGKTLPDFIIATIIYLSKYHFLHSAIPFSRIGDSEQLCTKRSFNQVPTTHFTMANI